MGFEPTPFRNRALIYRLRPLGHFYFLTHSSIPSSSITLSFILYLNIFILFFFQLFQILKKYCIPTKNISKSSLMYSAFSYYCESWLLLYRFLLFCCMWSITFLLSFQCELRLFSFCEFHIFLCLCWLFRNITNFLLNILWLFLNLSTFVFNLFAFIGLNIFVN